MHIIARPGEQESAPYIADAHGPYRTTDWIIRTSALVVDHQYPTAGVSKLSQSAVELVARNAVLLDQIQERGMPELSHISSPQSLPAAPPALVYLGCW